MALLDIRDAAVQEGLAVPLTKQQIALKKKGVAIKPPEGFVDAPRTAGILGDTFMHPALADHIDAMTKFVESKSKWQKFTFLNKMTAFYNPLFLPMYDIVQQTMLRGPLNLYKTVPGAGQVAAYVVDKNFRKAIKDVWKKTPDYYEALENGLASKPFNNPFKTWKRMLDEAKKTGGEKYVRLLEDLLPHKGLMHLYELSWDIAWRLDETIRMDTYNYLRNKDYNAREAAQIAAKYHSDYASVPAETRRKLNAFFFTPTFKITMGKLYGRMMTDAIKSTAKLGGVDKTTKAYAKGIIGTASILFAFDMFMTSGLKFDRDEFGRRYKKRVETEDGEKDLVVTWSTPANMFLKYIYRAKSVTKPGVENPIKSLLEQNKWEIHPIYRVVYDIIENKNGIGDKVYSEFDSRPMKAFKQTKYAITNIIQALSAFEEQPSNKEANKKFAEETSTLLQILTRPFTFKYMRNVEEHRAASKMNALTNRFRGEIFTNLRNKREAMPKEMLNNYLDQINKIQQEYEESVSKKK